MHPSVDYYTKAASLISSITLTYWFSCIFLPLIRRVHAMVSNSTASTDKVNVVRTLLALLEPVADSSFTLLCHYALTNYYMIILAHRIVVDFKLSPDVTRLYKCHISSDSSGINTTCLYGVLKFQI